MEYIDLKNNSFLITKKNRKKVIPKRGLKKIKNKSQNINKECIDEKYIDVNSLINYNLVFDYYTRYANIEGNTYIDQEEVIVEPREFEDFFSMPSYDGNITELTINTDINQCIFIDLMLRDDKILVLNFGSQFIKSSSCEEFRLDLNMANDNLIINLSTTDEETVNSFRTAIEECGKPITLNIGVKQNGNNDSYIFKIAESIPTFEYKEYSYYPSSGGIFDSTIKVMVGINSYEYDGSGMVKLSLDEDNLYLRNDFLSYSNLGVYIKNIYKFPHLKNSSNGNDNFGNIKYLTDSNGTSVAAFNCFSVDKSLSTLLSGQDKLKYVNLSNGNIYYIKGVINCDYLDISGNIFMSSSSDISNTSLNCNIFKFDDDKANDITIELLLLNNQFNKTLQVIYKDKTYKLSDFDYKYSNAEGYLYDKYLTLSSNITSFIKNYENGKYGFSKPHIFTDLKLSSTNKNRVFEKLIFTKIINNGSNELFNFFLGSDTYNPKKRLKHITIQFYEGIEQNNIDGLFKDWSKLESFNYSALKKHIKPNSFPVNMFTNCSSLTYADVSFINLDSDLELVAGQDPCYNFYKCTSLKEINLGKVTQRAYNNWLKMFNFNGTYLPVDCKITYNLID